MLQMKDLAIAIQIVSTFIYSFFIQHHKHKYMKNMPQHDANSSIKKKVDQVFKIMQ